MTPIDLEVAKAFRNGLHWGLIHNKIGILWKSSCDMWRKEQREIIKLVNQWP